MRNHPTSTTTYHVGLDDTDSSEGMCTTFLTFKIINLLKKKGDSRLIDYPNLIRLNPNIPWKTRGNASLVIRFESKLSKEDVFEICKKMVCEYATSKRANAGLVVFVGEVIPEEIREFSRRALYDVQRLSLALKIMDELQITYFGLRSRQGLVGALAGIGNELMNDYTFELIAYRRNCALRRSIEKSRVVEMDRRMRPLMFNSYDEKNDRVLIMPHGPDPVLLGVRGETSSAVRRAFDMLLPLKNLLGFMIFRSNQGTGEHLRKELCVSKLKAYTAGTVTGKVFSKPEILRGGHVYFELENQSGRIPCAAYEPTGEFRMRVLSLTTGDEIEVGGGVRKGTITHPMILNLEYMLPKKLSPAYHIFNPRCPKCSSSMSSKGKRQGFACKGCGFKSSSLMKSRQEVGRSLSEGQLYLPDLRAQRHLTKPIQRYLLEPREKFQEPPSRNMIFAQ
jgi:tRNA(Ile2)-agmatinylcytidine synthase